jgi:hypothetical protein
VSHHFDSAADRADGRINVCDLYAFTGAPGTSAVILTVNPDAGRSSPTSFRPDALYEFALIGDHHGRPAGKATPLVSAVDEILGTHNPVESSTGAGRRQADQVRSGRRYAGDLCRGCG